MLHTTLALGGVSFSSRGVVERALVMDSTQDRIGPAPWRLIFYPLIFGRVGSVHFKYLPNIFWCITFKDNMNRMDFSQLAMAASRYF